MKAAEIEVYYLRQKMPLTVTIYDYTELQQSEGKRVQITCPFLVSRGTSLALVYVLFLNTCMEINKPLPQEHSRCYRSQK